MDATLTLRTNGRVLIAVRPPALVPIDGTNVPEKWPVPGDPFWVDLCRMAANVMLAEHGQVLPKRLQTVEVEFSMRIKQSGEIATAGAKGGSI